MRAPRLRRAAALLTAGAAAGALLVACGGEDRADIDYVIDARVATYNVNTVDGHADGTLMALSRVLPGFSIVGPDGQIISDHDIGTVTEQPGRDLTLRYEFNRAAVYSDDKPMTCDDLFLAATALGGAPGFNAATHAGYGDIATVDCTPGEKSATVVFKRDRAYGQWRELFGAGTLLPAHVVARIAGVPNVVDALRKGEKATVAKIADAWNTAFSLTPGTAIDEATILSAGPYRIASYTVDKGLELVENDRWWGTAPSADEITVWPRGTERADVLERARASVVDSGDPELAAASEGAQTSAVPADRSGMHDDEPLAVTQLAFAGTGVGKDLTVRKALASCMPRDVLARQFGANGITWNLRTVSPADPLGPALNVQYGRRYPRADVPRAKSLLAARGPGKRARPTVRIGYLAPSTENKKIVGMIADSCAGAGLTVVDASSPDLTVGAIGKDVDAVLLSDGSFAASSTASGYPEVFAFVTGDPLNLSGLRNRAVTDAVKELSGTISDSARLPLVRGVETSTWDALPTIPLFGTVRVRESSSVTNVVPGLGISGTGWNMDRWTVS